MKPARPCPDELVRDRRGIVAVDGLPREIALPQPHDAATTEVDRGKDLEGHCHHHVSMLP